jgi:hypothetical protein
VQQKKDFLLEIFFFALRLFGLILYSAVRLKPKTYLLSLVTIRLQNAPLLSNPQSQGGYTGMGESPSYAEPHKKLCSTEVIKLPL